MEDNKMINFNNLKYERIDYDKTKKEIDILINNLINCNDLNEYVEYVKKINNIQNHIEEMFDYADIRNMRDSEDEFFKDEIDY